MMNYFHFLDEQICIASNPSFQFSWIHWMLSFEYLSFLPLVFWWNSFLIVDCICQISKKEGRKLDFLEIKNAKSYLGQITASKRRISLLCCHPGKWSFWRIVDTTFVILLQSLSFFIFTSLQTQVNQTQKENNQFKIHFRISLRLLNEWQKRFKSVKKPSWMVPTKIRKLGKVIELICCFG